MSNKVKHTNDSVLRSIGNGRLPVKTRMNVWIQLDYNSELGIYVPNYTRNLQFGNENVRPFQLTITGKMKIGELSLPEFEGALGQVQVF